jgi:aspartate aminotransferase
MGKIQSQETSAPSTISQIAGEAAYRGSLDAVFAMRDSFKLRRDFIVDEINAIPGVRCFRPGGAFYVFPDVSSYFGSVTPKGETIANANDLVMYLLGDFGIATVPGDAFGEPEGIRLSYAISMEELQEAAKRLRDGLASLSKS